jgi:hypothetical protein
MSQDESKIANHEEQDDVEAHRRSAQANDESTTESDDEVEAHVKRANHPRKA